MRYTVYLFLFLCLADSTFSQERQRVLDDFNDIKLKAAAMERVVLAPDNSDNTEANKRSLMAVRIMPRETYDNSFSSVRGGGAYYGFYYRLHDYGYGCELGWEQGILSLCSSDFAVMSDLGEVPIEGLSPSNQGIIDLGNYSYSPISSISEYQKARSGGSIIGQTAVVNSIKPVFGHTYLIRSIRNGYYDILVAFTVFRQDTDKSLILFSKILQQNAAPKRNTEMVANSDEQLRKNAQSWLRDERFKGIALHVSDRIITLSGVVDRQMIAYAIQLSNQSGALRTINMLEPR